MNALVKVEARHSPNELRDYAETLLRSRFYGFQNAEQIVALMLVAEAQGRHIASVVEEYSVIQGRPALKAEAMLARFQRAGGHVKWAELSDTRVAAVFSHAQCDPVEVDWDMDRARQAGLAGKGPWKTYPRQMLKARVISDGVRTAFPACLGGMYTPEEVGDFDPPPPSSRAASAPVAVPQSQQALPEAGAEFVEVEPTSAPVPSTEDQQEAKPIVQTLSKANARDDFKAIVDEIRKCPTVADLLTWGKANVKRVQLQPADWQKEIRKEYAERKDGLEYMADSARDAERVYEERA